MLCLRKVPVAEKFTGKRGGGGEYQDFPSIFMSHSAQPFRKRTLLSCVSETFQLRKIYAQEGIITIFYRKLFCLTVSKNFVEEPFSAGFQKFSGSEKIYGK